MFKRLLVPLDGSALAESVLIPAVYFAEKFHSTIVLFHATEPRPPATVHGEHHLSTVQEASQYLDTIAGRITKPGLSIEKHIDPPEQVDVARGIIRNAAELNADLILLCSHGHGGLRDWLIGSIAQQVIQNDDTPVLIVRPNNELQGVHKILIPLDSTPIHEPALPVAVDIARACNAAIHLVTVVPTITTLSPEQAATGMLLPSTMEQVLDLAERGASEYLESLKSKLSTNGIIATTEISRGDPASAILDSAERAGADLFVLATHGRRNIEAFWAGSVTPRLLSAAHAPVLLVRVSGEESAR